MENSVKTDLIAPIQQEGGQSTKQTYHTIKKYLIEAGVYVAIFLLTTILFLCLKPQYASMNVGMAAQSFIVLSLVAIACVGVYLTVQKKLTTRWILRLMLLAGLVLRIGYMLYTPASSRQHDVYSSSYNGHEGYAWTIFTTGKLPTSNKWQFYHPPMNALMQAGFMRFMNGLTGVFDAIFGWFGGDGYFPDSFIYNKPNEITDNMRYYLFQSCQILAVMYACITCVTLVKTIWLFDFSDKTKLIMAAFVIFFPRHIAFSGLLNNDPISYMFSMLALYHVLKWWKGGKSVGRIIACAVFLGLGMMSKLSSATIALPIAGIFLCEFVGSLRKKTGTLSIKNLFLQYGAFLLLCVPLGLWFQVYANVRFGQEFGYVPGNLTKRLYTGDYSFFERFVFPFDWSEFFGSIYCEPFEGNYWLFNFSLRSALFSESRYNSGEGFAVPAIVLAYLAAVALFVALIWCVVRYFRHKKRGRNLLKETNVKWTDLLFVFLLVQSQVLSEIYFYISAPYACTMDFRYIMPLILGMAFLIGYTHKILLADGGKASLVINRLVVYSSMAMLVCMAMFYCSCI